MLVSNETRILTTSELPGIGTVALILSCVAGLGMSYFSFALRAVVSATSFSVIGNICKVLTILVNILMWDQHASKFTSVQTDTCPWAWHTDRCSVGSVATLPVFTSSSLCTEVKAFPSHLRTRCKDEALYTERSTVGANATGTLALLLCLGLGALYQQAPPRSRATTMHSQAKSEKDALLPK